MEGVYFDTNNEKLAISVRVGRIAILGQVL